MVALHEKSASPVTRIRPVGGHGYLYKLSWESIQKCLRYLILDQIFGATNRLTYSAKHRAAHYVGVLRLFIKKVLSLHLYLLRDLASFAV